MLKGLTNAYTKPTKFIFIHIPKTAGTSTLRWLNDGTVNKNCHHTALQYKEILREEYTSFFKFAFVRNPWDRMLSFYKYYMSYDQHTLRETPGQEPFLSWLKKMDGHKLVGRTQLSYMTDVHNNNIIDFVGRFENLESDLNIISDKIKINLPDTMFHELPTKHEHYRDVYDDNTKDIVSNIFKDDIEHFNYEF